LELNMRSMFYIAIINIYLGAIIILGILNVISFTDPYIILLIIVGISLDVVIVILFLLKKISFKES